MFVTGQEELLWGKCRIWGPWRICKGESKDDQMFRSGVKKREVHCGAEGLRYHPMNLSVNKRAPGKGEEGEKGPSHDTIRHRTGSREARKGG